MTDYSIDRGSVPDAIVASGLRRAVRVGRFLAPILGMIVVWELIVRMGIADSGILPAPSAIAARAVELLSAQYDPVLPAHIAHSLFRALLAFALAELGRAGC